MKLEIDDKYFEHIDEDSLAEIFHQFELDIYQKLSPYMTDELKVEANNSIFLNWEEE